MINEEALNKKARKQIFTLLICSMILLAIDYGFSTFANSMHLYNEKSGSYMLRPEKGSESGQITLRAEVNSDGIAYKKTFDVSVIPYDSDAAKESEADANSKNTSAKMSEEELIAFEIREIINSINDDTLNNKVFLPQQLSSGEKISWKVEKQTNTAPIAFVAIMLAVLIYRNRLAPLKRQQEVEQESITKQLPEFVNRLVLLLSAGLVLNSAFEKAVEESSSFTSDKDFFYCKMREIYNRTRKTNSSMSIEFRDFAKSRRSSGDDTAKELMRISNIINDNISKGVELTDKLQHESEFLWLNRKRNCEERGRLAETKLTLPLTFFIIVLIVITVSPALLEL